MLPVSSPGTSASLTFHVSPLVLVTVVQPQAVEDDAATIATAAMPAAIDGAAERPPKRNVMSARVLRTPTAS